MPNYCARCLSRWNAKTPDERKALSQTERRDLLKSALTTVGGVRVCAEHTDAELERVENDRRGASA